MLCAASRGVRSFTMANEGSVFYFGDYSSTTDSGGQGNRRRRVRPPEKMARNRDLTAARRQEENMMISEFTEVLPLHKEQLKKADRTTLIRLALHFIKMKELLGSAMPVEMRKTSSTSTFSIGSPDVNGFVLMVDRELNILFASENMSEQLGPLQVDTIGQPLSELLHPEDLSQAAQSLESLFATREGGAGDEGGAQGDFITRMRTTLSTAVRSSSKIQYKNVFVTCRLKTVNNRTDSGETQSPSTCVAMLLCRSEDIKGIPEICLGVYAESLCDVNCCFQRIDIRGEWIFGYPTESLVGQAAQVLRHPGDQLSVQELIQTKDHIVRNGTFVSPPYRIITGWGDWFWVRSSFEPRISSSGQWKGFTTRTWIVATPDSVKSSISSSSSQSVSSQPPTSTQDLPGPSGSSSSVAGQQAPSPSGSSTHSGTSRCASAGLPEDADCGSSTYSPSVFSPPGTLPLAQPLSSSNSNTSPDIHPYESDHDPGARSSSDSSVDDILREVIGSKASHDNTPTCTDDGDVCGGSGPFLFSNNGSPCSNSHDSALSPQSNWSDNSYSNQQSSRLFPAESFSPVSLLGGIDSRTPSASTSGWNSAVPSPQNGSLPFSVLDTATCDLPASLIALSADVSESSLHFAPTSHSNPTITLSVNCGPAGIGAVHSDIYLGPAAQLPAWKEGSQWLY